MMGQEQHQLCIRKLKIEAMISTNKAGMGLILEEKALFKQHTQASIMNVYPFCESKQFQLLTCHKKRRKILSLATKNAKILSLEVFSGIYNGAVYQSLSPPCSIGATLKRWFSVLFIRGVPQPSPILALQTCKKSGISQDSAPLCCSPRKIESCGLNKLTRLETYSLQ